MRIAECECHHCGKEFKIEFKSNVDDYDFVICPICGNENCKVLCVLSNGEYI